MYPVINFVNHSLGIVLVPSSRSKTRCAAISIGFLVLFLLVGTVEQAAAQGGTAVGHVLRGYVREEGSSTAISDVTLELTTSGSFASPSVISGMDGEFHFPSLADGEYYITAKKEGYDPATVRVTVVAGGASLVVMTLHRTKTDKPTASGASVSARDLAIPEKAKKAFESGRKLLYDESNPEKAIPQFRRAIHEFPSYFEAYAQIGVADYRLNRVAEAESDLRKAVEVSANSDAESLYLLAGLLNDQRRSTDAEPLARQIVAMNDDSWQGHFELARALVGLGRGAEAESSANKARELKPDSAQTYLVLANAHMLQQKLPAVIQDFESYLRLEPNGATSDAIRQRTERLKKALQDGQKAPAAPAAKPQAK